MIIIGAKCDTCDVLDVNGDLADDDEGGSYVALPASWYQSGAFGEYCSRKCALISKLWSPAITLEERGKTIDALWSRGTLIPKATIAPKLEPAIDADTKPCDDCGETVLVAVRGVPPMTIEESWVDRPDGSRGLVYHDAHACIRHLAAKDKELGTALTTLSKFVKEIVDLVYQRTGGR